MSENSSENVGPPAPTVDVTGLHEIADGVWVIPDQGVPLVPNVGIILGTDAVLVVETGMGPANGQRVLETAQRLATGRKLYLTLTHFHPEHGYGAQAFKNVAEIIYNRVQGEELAEKGAAYLQMFTEMGPTIAEALEGTELVAADTPYDGTHYELDLGGRMVHFQTWGTAHTRGDQIVFLPEEKILFTGDLAEERRFPIFPYFPPDDVDVDGARWIEILGACQALEPAIVVPGHGEVGSVEIVKENKRYLEELAERVREYRNRGIEADDIIEELTPRIRQEYSDWLYPEWIEFGIRYNSDLA